MNRQAEAQAAATAAEVDQRVSQLEARVAVLLEATEVLARGLENGLPTQPGTGQAEKAARRAHELLLLAKTDGPGPSRA